MSRQLALRVGLSDLASFDNFYPGPNQEAVAAVREAVSGRPGLLFIHGPPGTGKSHLLYAAVKEAGIRNRPAVYVSGAAAQRDSGDWLDLPAEGLVCVDDIGEGVTPAEGLALFSLYEQMRNETGSLVLSSRLPPSGVDWALPDLRSRVNSGLVYRLGELDDRALERALRLRAEHRGIRLSDEVVRFVLRRYERSPSALFRLLDRVDVESLEQQRKVTVPFLRALEAESRKSPPG